MTLQDSDESKSKQKCIVIAVDEKTARVDGCTYNYLERCVCQCKGFKKNMQLSPFLPGHPQQAIYCWGRCKGDNFCVSGVNPRRLRRVPDVYGDDDEVGARPGRSIPSTDT